MKSRHIISLKDFKSQIYCVVDIVEKMRLVVYGKDQLRINSYLISLKRIFGVGIQLDYKMCLLPYFHFRTTKNEKTRYISVPKEHALI